MMSLRTCNSTFLFLPYYTYVRIIKMKIVIVAGGSGGHIYPAMTLAEALIQRGHEIVFFGSNDRMEKDVIPAKGFAYEPLDVVTTRGGVLQKVHSLLSIAKAYLKCLKLLKGYDMAIGFGNYISIPVMLAAKRLGLKTVIHEQNSFVGRANRLLDSKMDLIIGSYEENRKQFKNPHIHIYGNPQSSKALHAVRNEDVIKEMGLHPDMKTVVIFMGSLGSESVMKCLLDYFKLLDGSYQVVYATGKSFYQEVVSRISPCDYLKIYERIDGVAVMKNADLLISRAGATTLCEVSAIGIPSILIPSPYVPNNHQFHNALTLVNNGAALMIEEKDLSAERLFSEVAMLINDDNKLKEMSANAKKLCNSHVIEDIVEEVEKL